MSPIRYSRRRRRRRGWAAPFLLLLPPVKAFAAAILFVFVEGCGAAEVVPGAGDAARAEQGDDARADMSRDERSTLTRDSVSRDVVEAEADADARRDAGGDAVASACGQGAPPRGLQTVTVNGNPREYLVRVPAIYDPRRPLPLLFSFHGAGSTGPKFEGYMRPLATAVGDRAIIVYPTALLDPNEAKTTWSRNKADDIAFFEAMLAALDSRLCYDKGRVFATGFSSGGIFSNVLGCARGGVVRAIAAVAGGVSNYTNCRGAVAALEAIGTRDTDHYAALVASRDHYLAANGCRPTDAMVTDPNGCRSYAGCRAGLPVEYCEYDLGHTWPAWLGEKVWAFLAQF